MPSAPRTVARAAFPDRAAVSGLAGVMSPVGLTHLTMWAPPLVKPRLGVNLILIYLVKLITLTCETHYQV